jgi:ketosteroid isomerase-like protein
MSRPNIELVKVGLQAGAQRPKPDFETINDVYDPDHVFVPVSVETAEVKGGSGYKAWLEESEDIMRWTMEFEGAVEIGTRTILAEATMQFHGGSSEIDIEQRLWMIVTVENGRITRTEAYLDPAEALQAAGLRE